MKETLFRLHPQQVQRANADVVVVVWTGASIIRDDMNFSLCRSAGTNCRTGSFRAEGP
jgi:hypothetical protein